MTGNRLSQKEVSLFDRHGALFVDKEDADGVFARLQSNRDEASVHRVFDTFYRNASPYDLTNQWIADPGPFKYEMGWLVNSATKKEMAEYLRANFQAAYGLDTSAVQLIS